MNNRNNFDQGHSYANLRNLPTIIYMYKIHTHRVHAKQSYIRFTLDKVTDHSTISQESLRLYFLEEADAAQPAFCAKWKEGVYFTS